jgi:hypothetical protein
MFMKSCYLCAIFLLCCLGFTLSAGGSQEPAPDTIAMFRAHSNVYGDTAFLDAERYNQIAGAGFAGRLIPGTDFPITHYFNKDSGISPARQYAEDLKRLEVMMP